MINKLRFNRALAGALSAVFVFAVGVRPDSPSDEVPTQESVLSVCDVLRSLDRYRNKLVQVRGILAEGLIHSGYLTDNVDETPCAGLKKWPPSMHLIGPERMVQAEGPVDFVPQREAFHDMWSKIENFAPETTRRRVSATFVGKIESRHGIQIFDYRERGERGWMGNGYGHSGQFPAQLIIKTMTDVWVDYDGKRKRMDQDSNSVLGER